MIYAGLASASEMRLLDCINAVSDLLGAGLLGAAVDASSNLVELALLWHPGKLPDDFLSEDFEADFVALGGAFEHDSSELKTSHVLVDEWDELVAVRYVPIFWARDEAPETWRLPARAPWDYMRDGARPEVSGLTEIGRLNVHSLEVRNFSTRAFLDGVEQISVTVEGNDTFIDIVGDQTVEAKARNQQTLRKLAPYLSVLPERGLWRLRWLASAPPASARSWPLLSRRIPSTPGTASELT